MYICIVFFQPCVTDVSLYANGRNKTVTTIIIIIVGIIGIIIIILEGEAPPGMSFTVVHCRKEDQAAAVKWHGKAMKLSNIFKRRYTRSLYRQFDSSYTSMTLNAKSWAIKKQWKTEKRQEKKDEVEKGERMKEENRKEWIALFVENFILRW